MSKQMEFYSGLRGFHVYHNTVNWKPYVKEKITLKRELDNKHNKFAVAGRVTMRGKFGWIVVGHANFSLCLIFNPGGGKI